MGNAMNIKKCTICNKFYDVNSYEICPHCGNNETDEMVVEKKEKRGGKLFDFLLKPKVNKNNVIVVDKPQTDFTNNEDIYSDDNQFKTIQEVNYDEPQTEDVPDESKEDSDIKVKPIVPDADVMQKPERKVFNNDKSDNEMKTVQIYGRAKEPVVGWLVCVRGECMGEAFEIRGGSNKMGRDSEGDIIIPDTTVSREQAIIKFEPRKQEFYLVPVDNAAFIYINGDVVMDRVCLKPYTHIELGQKAEFVFVPLCNEGFNWDTYMNKE